MMATHVYLLKSEGPWAVVLEELRLRRAITSWDARKNGIESRLLDAVLRPVNAHHLQWSGRPW